MENTLENKAKFFALYFMQRVYNNSNYPENKNTLLDYALLSYTDKAEYLELKPLSSISEEDAIELAKIENDFTDPIRRGKAIIRFFEYSSYRHYTCGRMIDFLRSRGYALPWMGLSVEKLIEYGWIKLKED